MPWCAVCACALVLSILSGCAGTPGAAQGVERQAGADQSDNKRRAEIRLQLAIAYYAQRQFPVALDEINQALLADPTYADAYSMRALIHMEIGQLQPAESDFRQALRIAPNNPEFSNNYGWFLCQNGREKESIVYFEAALKNPAYQSPAKAMSNAGVCSLKFRDNAAAERYLTRAFQNDPSNLVTTLHLARLYFEQHNYERARFHSNRLIKSEMMTPEVLWLALRIENKLGDRLAEMSIAAQLRRRHPDSPEYAAYQRGAFDE